MSPQLVRLLARLDIRTPRELLLHLPLRYEDETRITAIADLRVGEPAQIEGVVEDCSVQPAPRRQLVARVHDTGGVLSLRFLHFYPTQQKQLAVGARVRVFGEARAGFFGLEMVHPRVHVVRDEDVLPQTLTPIYPTTAGLAQSALRKLIGRSLEREKLPELLPSGWLAPLALPSLASAIRVLHQPALEDGASLLIGREHPAWQRVKLEELLVQQLSLRRAHAERRRHAALALPPRPHLTSALLANVPFALTGAQARAWAEIAGDLAAAHPMHRLLQGDVGSGKTIVAALAMLQAAENGCQAALLAPTEILAEQHWLKLQAWMQPLGVDVAWVAGSQRKRQREAVLAELADHRIQLVVGTHALLEDPVRLPRLGLAVVDEQHRFGVRQRLSLRDKGGEGLPHMLMMSATPIPRTLAMSYYADLDVSVLDELPPGRTPILTRLVSATRRDEVVARVRAACLAGRQAYWVCPLIEESEALQLQTAEDTFALLTAALPELRIGLLHGRLKADEKSATMAAFSAGTVHLLVATTVIEVGVDVPNASLMVIEHAERFGLAQLHQLRGRVGRGAVESVCLLLYASPLSDSGKERLRVMHRTTDGFEIAREDLRIRGPGEFVGARQSGVPLLRFADLEQDADLIETARALAERLLREDPGCAAALIQRWLGGRDALLHA